MRKKNYRKKISRSEGGKEMLEVGRKKKTRKGKKKKKWLFITTVKKNTGQKRPKWHCQIGMS